MAGLRYYFTPFGTPGRRFNMHRKAKLTQKVATGVQSGVMLYVNWQQEVYCCAGKTR